VGRVTAVLVDSTSAEAAWLIARIGLLGRRAIVPVTDAVGAAGHVWVPYEAELIRAAGTPRSTGELTRERELELCAHYGTPDGVGRAAAVGPRRPGTVTARLAR